MEGDNNTQAFCTYHPATNFLNDLQFAGKLAAIKPKPRKGKKIPTEAVRVKLRAKQPCIMVVDGPAKIGKSSCLQELEKMGYVCHFHPNTPTEYSITTLRDEIARYQEVIKGVQGVVLVESSPWTYLQKHVSNLSPKAIVQAR
jgi:hypothetical protein